MLLNTIYIVTLLVIEDVSTVKIPEMDRLTCRDLISTAKMVCLIFLAIQMEVKYKLVAVWLIKG